MIPTPAPSAPPHSRASRRRLAMKRSPGSPRPPSRCLRARTPLQARGTRALARALRTPPPSRRVCLRTPPPPRRRCLQTPPPPRRRCLQTPPRPSPPPAPSMPLSQSPSPFPRGWSRALMRQSLTSRRACLRHPCLKFRTQLRLRPSPLKRTRPLLPRALFPPLSQSSPLRKSPRRPRWMLRAEVAAPLRSPKRTSPRRLAPEAPRFLRPS